MRFSVKIMGLSIALALLLTSAICFADTAPLYAAGNVLAAANFNDGPGSSDITLILRLSGDGEIYINEGSAVKYIYDPDNEGVDGWIEPDFSDSGWADGTSGVGFADSDDNTTTPSGLMSIWTRYQFDAPNAASISELTLLADYDDQYIVWLNGVMIAASANAPAGDPPAWDASAGGTENHGATEMAADTPNAARWTQAVIESTAVDFEFVESETAVESSGKLSITWGSLKR